MAKSSEQLFDVFAARVAEILRERYGMDPEPLLCVSREQLTIEGLVRGTPDGGPEWHRVRTTPEQLEWSGPDAIAEAFVREYISAFEAARR